MLKLESRIGKIPSDEKRIYSFLSDFNNLAQFMPDRVKNWKADADSCTFTVDGFGDTGLRIIEKEPFKLIKITGQGSQKLSFFLWVQLKQVREDDTRVRLTIHSEMNPMMSVLAKNPLQKLLDMLVDRMEEYSF